MPQSLSRILIHTAYSTKDRLPFLRDLGFRSEAHAYLAGCAKALDCLLVRIGGTEDHVHLLTTLSRTVTVADFVKETKRNTTLWVKEETGHRDFSWQAGYGCFSVSESQLPVIARYVDNQEEHHRKSTFQDEYRELLRLHGQGWDEKIRLGLIPARTQPRWVCEIRMRKSQGSLRSAPATLGSNT